MNKNPKDLRIVGIDCPVAEWPEMADEDRDHVPSKGLIASIKEFGVQVAVTAVKRGKLFYVKDGRRRTLAARAAELAEIPVDVVPDVGPNAPLHILAANSYRQDDPIWVKAKHAERLREQGFKPDQICAALEEGGKPISKMTLTNYRRLLNCKPEIMAKIQSGELPVTAGYLAGAAKVSEQDAAVEEFLSKYVRGDEGEDTDDGEPREPKQRRNGAARAMPKGKLQEFRAYLEPADDDEPDHDCDLAFAILEVVLGNDPDGEGLRPFKEVNKLFKKAMT